MASGCPDRDQNVVTLSTPDTELTAYLESSFIVELVSDLIVDCDFDRSRQGQQKYSPNQTSSHLDVNQDLPLSA